MMTFLNRIYLLGTDGMGDDYKKGSIKLSNIIALIFILTGVIYGVISVFLAPELINVCVILFLGSGFILLLNLLKMVDFSRFMLTVIISLDVAIYHAYIVQPGEQMLVSIYIGQFVVAILPWIFIDIREKWLLISCLLFSLLVFIIQPWSNEFLNIEMDSMIFRGKLFTIPTYFFSLLTLLYCMYLLQNKSLKADNDNKELIKAMDIRNKEMEIQHQELQSTLEKNRISQELEEKRNWIAKGISQIGELMRGEIDDNFYQHLVSSIVNFMKINQAGIYTVEEEEEIEDQSNIIILRACYAFDRQKYLKKKIEIGQGLVGQCYLEKEPIYLKKVPETYINITSGLGDSNPRTVFIVPLIHDEIVKGIIEIATFKELKEHEMEFLTKLSGTIASFISANRINMLTKRLLQQSQQQSEELRATEEEMRQNMEEIQASQEEIHRKEQEYVDRIAELEKELEEIKI